MEPEWRASAFDWDERALRAVPLQPPSPCRPGLSSAQALSQATGGSGEGSAGGQPPTHTAAGGKAGRRARSGRTPSACQVEGCGISLESGKPFYRLQRICEQHARALTVTDASGTPLRFCQQCTRLHPVADFEGVKRSCVVSLQRRMERKHRAQQKRAAERMAAAGGTAVPPSRRTRAASSNRAAAAAYADTSSGEGTCTPSWTPSTSGEDHARACHSGGAGSGSTDQYTATATAAVRSAASQPVTTSQLAWHGADSRQLPTTNPSVGSLPLPGPLLAAPAGDARCGGGAWPLGASDPASLGSLLVGSLPPPPLQQLNGLPSLQPAQQAGGDGGARLNSVQAALSRAEIDELLVMDPDELALALLARTSSSAAAAAAHPLAAPSTSLDAFLACTQLAPPPTAAPPTLVQAATLGLGQHVQSGLLNLLLSPPVKAEHPQHSGAPELLSSGPSGGSSGGDASLTPASAPASNPFALPPSSLGLLDMPFDVPPPSSLQPASLPLAAWPAAHESAALLQWAHMPLQQAAAAAAGPASVEGQPIIMRFSLKVYGMLPDQLPPHLQAELESAIVSSPTVIMGTVRCGCTFLTADLLLSAAEAEALAAPGGAAAALAHLLHAWQGGGDGDGWRPPALPALRMLAQAETAGAAVLLQPLVQADGGGRAALAPAGGGVCAVALDAAQQQRLEVQLVGPASTTVAAARGRFMLRCPEWQQLVVGEAGAAPRVLHCRSRGTHVALALMSPGADEGSDEPAAGMAAADADGSCDSGDEAEAAEAAEEERVRLRLQQQQGAEVWVAAAQQEWGLYEFELAAGHALGNAAPVLVLPDGMEAEASELQQLQVAAAAAAAHAAAAAGSAGSADAQRLAGFTSQVVRLVSLVLVYREEAAAAAAAGGTAQAAHAAAYPPAAVQRVASVAAWLCALCMRCRFPALLRQLLPATTAAGDASGAVAAMDALLPAGVLGTAAAAGSTEMLGALADWAAAVGCTWRLTGAGSYNLTPLHLAAALGPGMTRAAADALVALVGSAAAQACWSGAHAAGWTPRQVATAAGNAALLAALGEHPPAPGPSPTSPQGSGEPHARDGGPSSGAKARAAQKLAELAEHEAAAQAEAAHVELNMVLQAAEKKGDSGGSLGGSPTAAAAALRGARGPPASAAQLAAWQQRPMQPAVLLAVGGAAILVALAVVAALRAGIYA